METATKEMRLVPTVTFTKVQDEFLRDWYANGWLPSTLVKIEAQNDIEVGLTQAHVDEFWNDVLFGHRCKTCGVKNFGDDDCWMEEGA